MRAYRLTVLVCISLCLLALTLPAAAQQPGDRDGDGVRDALDLCPNERGPITSFGCAAPRTGMGGAAASPVPMVAVGGRVWNDRDADGTQDADEPGLAGVQVELRDSSRTSLLASTRTDGAGFYSIGVPVAGSYRLRIGPTTGYDFSPKDAAGEAADSDFIANGVETGFSDILDVTTAATPRIDAGLRPSTTVTPTPNLFNAQAAPAMTLVLAPIVSPTPAPVLVEPVGDVQAIFTETPSQTPLPDRDGDGWWDGQDACPYLYASPTSNGCPLNDRDGDDVPNPLDRCPDTSGITEYGSSTDGCPFTDPDGDGLSAPLDECPDQPAPISPNGCPLPDSDGDGIFDIFDQCPGHPGVSADGSTHSLTGCPPDDRDNDGHYDILDRCPDEPSPFTDDGCPGFFDRDGDGIPNREDTCPETYGLTFNGCPPGVNAPSATFTPTLRPSDTPSSVDLNGPTPGFVFVPSRTPTPAPVLGADPLGGAQAARTIVSPRSSATPTALTFSGQVAPIATFIGVLIATPTDDGSTTPAPITPSIFVIPSLTPSATASPAPPTATTRPMVANPLAGAAQAAIANASPRSSATPAAVQVQPDGAVQAVNTPVDGEPVQPTTSFDRDGDFIPDTLDSCPDEQHFTPDGCPPLNLDRDGDGTLDYADACPDQPGDLTSRAHDMECPDTDNDGWTDNVDDCPDQPALLFGGCPVPPDRDGDGVLDNDDQCPDVRHESSSGCPDSDGDGLNDSGDACPNQPAPLSANGCPTENDRDGDAIPNQVDRCPDSFNLTLNGCPPGVSAFTPTHTPTITPASVDLTGPTPGLVFVPSPVPTATPVPQAGSPLDGAQAAITVIPLLPSATPTGLTFSGQIAPALTLELAPSTTPSPPGVIGISPTPAATQGPTPTMTLTPNLVFQPPAIRVPASLAWDPFSTSPLLSTRNLSFTDPNPPGSGAQLVVVLSVTNGELFTFDPVMGRLAGRRLVFDTVQELTNLLAGLYYLPGEWDGSNPRIVLQATYLRGANDRSPVITAEIEVIVPRPTPPG